jgi:hypothetical protein
LLLSACVFGRELLKRKEREAPAYIWERKASPTVPILRR